MFDHNTVIVLGAGASAHFGFPLGVTLRNEIVKGIQSIKGASQSGLMFSDPYSVNNARYFYKNRFRALITCLGHPLHKNLTPFDRQNENALAVLCKFLEAFQYTSEDTIDAFLLDNPDHSKIGKILLAMQVLLEMFYSDDQEKYRLKPFAARDVFGGRRPRRNWYSQLFNVIRKWDRYSDDEAQGKLTFVTFNYDWSLDLALKHGLNDTQAHRDRDLASEIEILHVNGAPSAPPQLLENAGQYILESAEELYLIDEAVDSNLKEIRRNARQAIAVASRVYVIGYDFAKTNNETIGISGVAMPNKIFCMNFDGNVGLDNRIQNLGIPKGNIMGPKLGTDFRFIDEAINDGFLEREPNDT